MKKIALLVVTVLASCFTQHNDDSGMVLIMDDPQEKNYHFQDLGISVVALVIDPAGEHIISQITSLCFADQYLYLLDRPTASVFIVDPQTGNVLKSVQYKGSGPKEYIDPAIIRNFKDNIYIYDIPTNRVLRFDMDMNFIDVMVIPVPLMDFVCMEDGLLTYNPLTFNYGLDKFYFIDYDASIKAKFSLGFEYEFEDEVFYVDRHPIFMTDNGVFLSELYSNTIDFFDIQSSDAV